jgi:peptide/nickel transport system substrate-binding protein
MRNKLFIIGTLLIVASMILGACAQQPATPEVQVQVTEVVKTVEVMVEGTPMVVTATPEPPPPPATFNSTDPSTFVFTTFGDVETLDPALDYESAGIGVMQNIYETLLFYDREKPTEFIPQLATDWTISDDGMTYTFNIRQGVKFHNGNDMTPSDVAYSFQRGLLQGGYASPQWLLAEPFFGVGVDDISIVVDPTGAIAGDPDGVKAADPAALVAACEKVKEAIVADDAAGTVTMQLATPWGPFLGTLASSWGSVMDQDWVIENGGWDGSCDTWQNTYSISSEEDPFTPIANGTGPFMLDQWIQGQELDLVRNDNYWRTEPAWEGGPSGPAAFERVVRKVVTEWGTRFAMTQAGDTDFVTVNREDSSQIDPLVGERCEYNVDTNSFDPCQPTDNPDAPLRLWIGAPQVTHSDVFFTFNIANPDNSNPLIGSGKLDGNGIPPDFFSDIHIRKAFNYCFDWDTYIQDALVGEAIQTVGIALAGMPGYDFNGPHYTFDLDKCAEEFQASTLTNENGESVWDVGFRLQAAYNTGNTSRRTVAEILATSLAEVNENFQIETIGMPWPTYLRNQRASTLPLFVSGWIEDIHDPHNWFQPYLVGTYGRRQVLPDDIIAQFQELVDKGVAESDPAKRAVIYTELNQLVYDIAPGILLATATQRHYEQRWVNGWYYNPIYAEFYYYAYSKN